MTTTSPGQPPDVIEWLYRAARERQLWPEALSRLAEHTGATSAMIATFDRQRGVGSVVTSAGREPADVDHIAEQILRHRSGGETTDGRAAGAPRIVRVASKGSLEEAKSHLALPRPALCGGGRAGWISITLHDGPPALHEQAERRLSSLHEHLMRALDITRDLAGARSGTSSGITMLSAMPTAALLLGAGAGILQANVAARMILALGDAVLETAERRLGATLPRENQKLARAIEIALAASRGERTGEGRQVVRIRRPVITAPLLMILDPVTLNSPPSFFDEPDEAVLVRMIDEEHTPDTMTYPLQAAFDLTPAEARIAAVIASGRSPATAAKHLDLSTNTVRSHLARIFDKTGTRSQHALTRLLAAIGSWPLP